jgi:predicted CXXCH cytochrome family protein
VAILAGASVCAHAPAQPQPQSVVDTPHNLSASGRGALRSAGESEVCVFCHAPHNSSPIRPLWNRATPVEAYTIYTSRALEAQPGQPTGVSKMCLSCHDGTIAVGSVLSRDSVIQMARGMATLPRGASNLGTDLSDDHPISFKYDTTLSGKDPKVRSPTQIPHETRLDSNGELQCTTCHDAHSNKQGKFLVMQNSSSELCLSCHQVGTTTIAGHSQCADCHQPHTAPSGPYLLRQRTATETCLRCHGGGTPMAADIASEIHKVSSHDTNPPVDPPLPLSEHASCTSCHEPHTMARGSGVAPGLHPSLGRMDGISTSGAALAKASTEAEVCFKCHADGNKRQPFIARRSVQNNTRQQFSSSAVSFHPVLVQGRNPTVPSLRPGWTTGSLVYCSSCHASETSPASGGAGLKGVHGSQYAPLLAARYDTSDFSSESASTYALCYQCHDRANILSNASFPQHSLHIVDQHTPCSACHDAHGISATQGSPRGNSNLINFDISIVHPSAAGRLEFIDQGQFAGECFLSCHGVDHGPKAYPAAASTVRSGPSRTAPARPMPPRR